MQCFPVLSMVIFYFFFLLLNQINMEYKCILKFLFLIKFNILLSFLRRHIQKLENNVLKWSLFLFEVSFAFTKQCTQCFKMVVERSLNFAFYSGKPEFIISVKKCQQQSEFLFEKKKSGDIFIRNRNAVCLP